MKISVDVLYAISIGWAFVCAFLFFILLKKSYKKASEKKEEEIFVRDNRTLKNKLLNSIEDELKGSKLSFFKYDNLYTYLKKNGRMVDGVRNTTPEMYILTKIILTIVFALIALIFTGNILLAIIFAIFGLTFQDILIWSTNREDNRNMVEDIQRIYELISLQTRSSIYISDTFYDCYYFTKNARLKRALLELDAEVKITHNLSNALEEFDKKFNNESISLLARSIRQASEAGHLASSLDQMKEEMLSLQEIQNHIYEDDLSTKFTFILITIFGSTVFIMIYAMFGSTLSELTNLFI